MMLFPIIILIILVFVIFNSKDRERIISFRGDEKKALDILDRRFANGEISEDEYLQRKSVLIEK